mmetsp:Transcript_15037/g.18860  ORF Transcript_15037/g.18860 Transcript_15037/m.18860 type:complete len:220 (+) Transcript_15037:856-1515(+)
MTMPTFFAGTETVSFVSLVAAAAEGFWVVAAGVGFFLLERFLLVVSAMTHPSSSMACCWRLVRERGSVAVGLGLARGITGFLFSLGLSLSSESDEESAQFVKDTLEFLVLFGFWGVWEGVFAFGGAAGAGDAFLAFFLPFLDALSGCSVGAGAAAGAAVAAFFFFFFFFFVPLLTSAVAAPGDSSTDVSTTGKSLLFVSFIVATSLPPPTPSRTPSSSA